MIYSPDGLMRYNDSYAIVDDIPLLSQWIKKFQVRRLGIFWQYHPNLNHGYVSTTAEDFTPRRYVIYSVLSIMSRTAFTYGIDFEEL